MIETNTQHIDRLWSEDARVAEGRLIRLCSLESLLESAAICNASEDARDKLRVIHVAEPEEDLILLVRVHVYT